MVAMKKAVLLIAIFISTVASAQMATGVTQIAVPGLLQKVTTDKKADETLYVVNFWATWCMPCVKELPYFEAVNKKYADKNVKVMLVSLDFLSDSVRVKKFAEFKKLQSEVYQLNAGNPNDWIDKFDTSWDGAIPVTIMYKGGEKVFFRQGDFEATELDSIINTKIK